MVRCFLNDICHKEFIGFHSEESLTAESLTKYIVDSLKRAGIDITHCIAQSYDGASVVSGRIGGAHQKIREHVEWAVYVYCYTNRINLVTVECCKSITDASDFFASLQQVYNFISGSYIHSCWIKFQAKMFLVMVR